MHFAYEGFEQDGDIRHFLFRAVEGSGSRALSILIDLGLMAKNGVAVQEGPMLCLRLLNGAAERTPDSLDQFISYTVVNADLQSILFERQQKELERLARKSPRKPWRRPLAQSNLHL